MTDLETLARNAAATIKAHCDRRIPTGASTICAR